MLLSPEGTGFPLRVRKKQWDKLSIISLA